MCFRVKVMIFSRGALHEMLKLVKQNFAGFQNFSVRYKYPFGSSGVLQNPINPIKQINAAPCFSMTEERSLRELQRRKVRRHSCSALFIDDA